MTSKTKNFSDYFEEFCIETYGKTVSDKLKDDAEYIDTCQKHQLLYDKIRNELDDNSDLIDEFDVLKNYSNRFQCKHIYHQGFTDCIYMLRWMGII